MNNLLTSLSLMAIFPYIIFPLIISFLSYFTSIKREKFSKFNSKPSGLTILISIFNEEKIIYNRLKNISIQNFSEPLEVFVVLDGCEDDSLSEVMRFKKENKNFDLNFHISDRNFGQAKAQNLVAKKAKYNIILKTDAGTIFNENFLSNIFAKFSDDEVAVVGGCINFCSNESFTKVYKLYFKYEQFLRKVHYSLGYPVKVSGACTAFRKDIWSDIDDFEDVDQVITIFAERQNYKVFQEFQNCCIDFSSSSAKKEIASRSRMTAKGLKSTFKYLSFNFFLKHTIFCIFLISHKVMRYLSSPLILVISLILVYELINYSKTLFLLVILLLILSRRLRSALLSILSSLIGQTLGIYRAFFDKKLGPYKPTLHK